MSPSKIPLNRIVWLLFFVFGCLWLSACGGSGGDGAGRPGDVVKKYVTALTKGDIPTALTCIAPEKRKMAEPILQMGVGVASAFTKTEGGLDAVTILREEVEGDRA